MMTRKKASGVRLAEHGPCASPMRRARGCGNREADQDDAGEVQLLLLSMRAPIES